MFTEKTKVLVAIDALPDAVWKPFECQKTFSFVRDGIHAGKLLDQQTFDVVFLDLFLNGLDALHLLRKIRSEHPGVRVVLTSEAPNFQFARQGLLYGACDYLLRPFTVDKLSKTFSRMEFSGQAEKSPEQEALLRVRRTIGTSRFPETVSKELHQLCNLSENAIETDQRLRRFFESVINLTFQDFPWLASFLDQKDFNQIHGLFTSDKHLVRTFCEQGFNRLYDQLWRLYPETDDELVKKIMIYLLEHVDTPLSQKEVAQEFFMSASALSERFSCALHLSYREYSQRIRMSRASWFLRNTNLKLYEICDQMGFKDVNYFSRQFRQQNGMTVSEYRMDDGNWEFQI